MVVVGELQLVSLRPLPEGGDGRLRDPLQHERDLLGEGPRLRPPRLPGAPPAPPEGLARLARSAASPLAASFAPACAASAAAAPERRLAAAIASSIAAERYRQLANSPVLIRSPAAPYFCSRGRHRRRREPGASRGPE